MDYLFFELLTNFISQTYFPRPADFAFIAKVTGPKHETMQQNLHDLNTYILNLLVVLNLEVDHNEIVLVSWLLIPSSIMLNFRPSQMKTALVISYPPHLHKPCFHVPFLIPYFKFIFVLFLISNFVSDIGTIIYFLL